MKAATIWKRVVVAFSKKVLNSLLANAFFTTFGYPEFK